MGPNCLQRFSDDKNSRRQAKSLKKNIILKETDLWFSTTYTIIEYRADTDQLASDQTMHCFSSVIIPYYICNSYHANILSGKGHLLIVSAAIIMF